MSEGNRARPPVARDAATLKVLDVGNFVAGPFAASMLGDLGAEVIKVEPPRGDLIRDVGTGPRGYSYQWQVHGRNKRSVTLDLRAEEGRDIFRRLAEWADVLVENLRPGVLSGWGLGYHDLSRVNPRLVYVSVSGWGQTGPYRERPSFEFAASAFGGLTYVNGAPDRPPVVPGLAVMDHTTALFATIGALEAVRRRDAAGPDGRGAHVDIALYEPALRIANDVLALYASEGKVWEREGSEPSGQEAPHIVYGYAYETSDHGYVSAFATTRKQWEALVTLIGMEHLKDDESLRDDRLRKLRSESVVDPALRTWVAKHTRDEVMAALADAGVPSAPINSAADIVENEHVAARGNLETVVGVRGEPVTMQGVMPRITGAPNRVRWAAEELGASNVAVYQDLLGMSAEECDALHARGVI